MEKRYKTYGFFTPRVLDTEELDYDHSETIPDQSLTVREILTNFTRSGRMLPDYETGSDEDIDSSDDVFDDMVDAIEAVASGRDEILRHRKQYKKDISVKQEESSTPLLEDK